LLISILDSHFELEHVKKGVNNLIIILQLN